MGLYSFEGSISTDKYEEGRRGLNKYVCDANPMFRTTLIKGDLHLVPKSSFLKGNIHYSLVDPFDSDELYGRHFKKNENWVGTGLQAFSFRQKQSWNFLLKQHTMIKKFTSKFKKVLYKMTLKEATMVFGGMLIQNMWKIDLR